MSWAIQATRKQRNVADCMAALNKIELLLLRRKERFGYQYGNRSLGYSIDLFLFHL
jgi:hypothetical protein